MKGLMAKILIIEDDQLVARMYMHAFLSQKFEAVVAENGRVGLEKAKSEKPNIILLDIMMPEMNGLDVLNRLKADPELSKIPVIVLTNLAGTQDSEIALARGAKAYLVKSEYKPKDVVTVVKGFLNQVA